MKNLSFGGATALLNKGQAVCRKGWNGKGLFVFRQVPATIDWDIISKMQSLPERIKEIFDMRFGLEPISGGNLFIKYSNQLALVDPDNNITGWSPSTSDALAEDWELYDPLE